MSSSRKRKRQKTTASSSTVPKVYPPKSLLYGHDAKILDAVAHVGIEDKCVLTIHNALVELGLGWVSIGDHAHRQVCGSIYDRAKETLAVSSRQHLPKPNLSTIHVEERVLNNSHCYNSTDHDCMLSPKDAKSVLKSIQETGMALIKGAVDISKIDIEKCEDTTKTPKRIKATKGNGKAGIEDFKHPKNRMIYGSYYNDMKKMTYLDDIQTNLYKSLLSLPTAKSRFRRSKRSTFILDTPKEERIGPIETVIMIQSVLMLSDAKEYGGGEFYVATKEESLIVRTSCPKLNAGDLVIFQAGTDGNYYHGMRTVTSGERKAIGLFQEVAKSK
jgi:hypothetical protein